MIRRRLKSASLKSPDHYVIVQSNLTGHRLEYIRHVVIELLSRSQNFTIWIESEPSTEDLSNLTQLSKTIRLVTGNFNPRLLLGNHKSYQLKVLFLDGDRAIRYVLRWPMFFLKTQSTFLLLRLSRPTSFLRVRELAAFLTKGTLAVFVNVLTRSTVKRLVFLRSERGRFFRQVRDPLPSLVQDGSGVKNSRDGSVIRVGIVGTLDPRKNIKLASKAISLLGKPYILRLAGFAGEGYRRELEEMATRNSSLSLNIRSLSEADFISEIQSLDCFLVLQNTNAPSGTLLRALSLGTPCVVGGAPILRKSTAQYSGLVASASLTVESVVKAIKVAVTFERIPALDLPSPSNFAEDLLRENLQS